MTHQSKYAILAILISLWAAIEGCVSTKPLSSDPAASEKITRESDMDAATISFRDGSAKAAYHVAVRTDSTEWYSKSLNVRSVAATSDIVSISVSTPNILGGIAWGLVAGSLPSLLVATLVAQSYFVKGVVDVFTSPPSSAQNDFNAANTAFWEGGGIGMATSGIIGGLIGSGHRTEYKP